MGKQIKLADDTYGRLKHLADINHRSLGGQIEFLMDNQIGSPEPFPEENKNNSEASLIRDVFGGEQLDIEKDFTVLRRNPQVILAEIRQLEAEMDEKITHCQDKETAQGILLNYRGDINKLWAEYHEVKG